MDSFHNNESADELINWNSPEIEHNNNNTHNYSINYINNPFDLLELKAAKHSGANNVELNSIDHVNDNVTYDQPKDDCFTIYANKEIVNKSKENSVLENEDFNTVVNKAQIFESALVPMHNEEDIENIFICNEEEKNKIREETRQRIMMLIEKEKLKYKETNIPNSIFCTPPCNSNELSLNKSDNLFNRGFIQDYSDNNFISFNKPFGNIIDNDESIFSDHELNHIDLNSIQPVWLEDEFSDFDASPKRSQTNKSVSISKPTDDVDKKLKIISCIEDSKSKQNGYQIYKDSQQESSIMEPVASSTPTSDIATMLKNPLSEDFSIQSKCNLSQQSVNSIDSPKTPLNVTRHIKASSTNITATLSNKVNKKNTMTLRKTFKLNKTKSENKIVNISKKLVLNTNRLSNLPIPKQSNMKFRGKENMKPQ